MILLGVLIIIASLLCLRSEAGENAVKYKRKVSKKPIDLYDMSNTDDLVKKDGENEDN